MKKTNSFIC